jgi:HNH endonuclease/AP2 domain
MTGHLPTLEIDHINGDRDDNRWINLRQVTASVNMKNLPLPRTNKSGTPGVIWHKRDEKWQASIKVDRRTVHLGYFESKQDAIAARKVAERQYGFHPNHGRLA